MIFEKETNKCAATKTFNLTLAVMLGSATTN